MEGGGGVMDRGCGWEGLVGVGEWSRDSVGKVGKTRGLSSRRWCCMQILFRSDLRLHIDWGFFFQILVLKDVYAWWCYW